MIYYAVFNVTFYLSSLVLFLIDYYKIFIKHKIQPKKINDMMNVYRKIIPNVIFNSLIGVIPFSLILRLCVNIFNLKFSWIKFTIDIFLSRYLGDVFFFAFHKLLHHPKLYKQYHKKHHEITAPIGCSAIYMTLTDLYLGNIIPIYLPLFLLSSHFYTVIFWMIITTLNTVIKSHSGFEGLSDFHDKHHSSSIHNFGLGIFMDKLYGTEYVKDVKNIKDND